MPPVQKKHEYGPFPTKQSRANEKCSLDFQVWLASRMPKQYIKPEQDTKCQAIPGGGAVNFLLWTIINYAVGNTPSSLFGYHKPFLASYDLEKNSSPQPSIKLGRYIARRCGGKCFTETLDRCRSSTVDPPKIHPTARIGRSRNVKCVSRECPKIRTVALPNWEGIRREGRRHQRHDSSIPGFS